MFKNESVNQVHDHRHLGVLLSDDMSWTKHVKYICAKAFKQIGLRKNSFYMNFDHMSTYYKSVIRPIVEYASVIYDGCTKVNELLLERVQYRAAIVCTGAKYRTESSKLLQDLALESLKERRKRTKLIYFFRIKHSIAPGYLCERLIQSVEKPRVINYLLRSGHHNVDSIAPRLEVYETSFFPSTLVAWNELPDNLKTCSNVFQFKKELGEYLKTLNVSAEVSLNHQNSAFQFSFYCTGYYGKILNQIRYGLSPLHMHLFTYNITDNPFCPECHDVVENSSHYFLKCGKYDLARTKMLYSIKAM